MRSHIPKLTRNLWFSLSALASSESPKHVISVFCRSSLIRTLLFIKLSLMSMIASSLSGFELTFRYFRVFESLCVNRYFFKLSFFLQFSFFFIKANYNYCFYLQWRRLCGLQRALWVCCGSRPNSPDLFSILWICRNATDASNRWPPNKSRHHWLNYYWKYFWIT